MTWRKRVRHRWFLWLNFTPHWWEDGGWWKVPLIAVLCCLPVAWVLVYGYYTTCVWGWL